MGQLMSAAQRSGQELVQQEARRLMTDTEENTMRESQWKALWEGIRNNYSFLVLLSF